jgi:hypothetical protein
MVVWKTAEAIIDTLQSLGIYKRSVPHSQTSRQPGWE